MDPKQLLAATLRSISEKYQERSVAVQTLSDLRGQESVDEAAVASAIAQREAIDADIDALEFNITKLRAEIAGDQAAALRAEEIVRGAELPEQRDEAIRVGAEEAVYRADQDPKGHKFMRDITMAHMGNTEARSRLERSTKQLFDERAQRGKPVSERAVGTAQGSGFAIPQYLTDLFAPNAKEGAQLANEDNMTVRDLPETGMVAYLPKATASTEVDVQEAQGDDVAESDFDDDLITVPILTAAGSQSFRRQAIDRAPGLADEALKDLVREFYTDMDRKVINRATTGLLAAGSAVTYTDSTPTVIELNSKILQAIAAVEDALKDQSIQDDVRVLMRRNRWRWMQNQFIDTHPFIAGTRAGAQGQGTSTGLPRGVRGYLPSDDPVVTDSNIPANLGSGTNEDRIAVYAKSEAHLWLDPDAPLMIRAEQTQSKALTIDYVVYGYFAFCFTRRTGAVQIIAGTGLVAPTF